VIRLPEAAIQAAAERASSRINDKLRGSVWAKVSLAGCSQFDEHLVVRVAALRQLWQACRDAHAAAVGQVVGQQLFAVCG
jgi:hypothetical protein